MTSIASLEPMTCAAVASSGVGAFVPPMGALAQQMSELAAVVTALSDSQYVHRPVGAYGSGIGSHVRHVLDHVRAFLDGLEHGRIDYEHRVRGTDVECSRLAALRAIRNLERRACAMMSQRLDRTLRLTSLITARGPAVEVTTSTGRELAFVLSHTTHHNAMVAAMARTMGVGLPDEFGMAPSTLAYHAAACAR